LGRECNGEGRSERGEKVGKWEGALDYDICPGAPELRH